jgi:hypothetical protein
MKIFYAVQMSNFTLDNGTPKWLMRNDACVNICVGIVSTLLERYPDFSFLIKLPPAADTSDVKNLDDLFEAKYLSRIEFYRETIPVSPVTSRFNFDFGFHQKHATEFKDVDVMINDENTLAKNWRHFFKSIGKDIPMVTTNYFLDSPILPKSEFKLRYYERQVESMFCSEAFAFPVEAAMKDALEAIDLLYRNRDGMGKPLVWGIGAYYGEVAKYHSPKRKERPIIYFGNRITDSVNRYTNWHSFAEAIGKLSELVDPSTFEAVMLNPTRKATNSQLKEINYLSKGHVRVISNEDAGFTREQYLKFINEASISCNIFTGEVHGGCTHIEAMMARNIMVAPAINDYLHKYKDSGKLDGYPFLFECDGKTIDTDLMAQKLQLALEVVNTDGASTLPFFGQLNEKLAIEYESYERFAEKIGQDLLDLVPMKALA